MKYKPPVFRLRKYTKITAYRQLGKAENVQKLLGVSKKTYQNWGKHIPAPFADRIWFSNWGEKKIQAHFVPVEDALVIFKTFNAMAAHFGKTKSWKEDMLYLPEPESAYMVRHFKKFVRVYSKEELTRKHYA